MSTDVCALIIGIDGWDRYTYPLIQQITACEPDCKIVVIDNASAEPYPELPIVHRTERLCYSAAINEAKRIAGESQWTIVLSNDVRCHGQFAEMLLTSQPGVYGPYMAHNSGWNYIEGWCVCVPESIWQALGGWDERFLVSSWEDVDFSQSVREAGYPVVEDKSIPFVHLNQAQRFRLPEYPGTEMTNFNYFFGKHPIAAAV
jgi:hypothetical protein